MLSVTQRQLNLKHYYLFYIGDIDGIEKAQTKQAYERFQKDQKLGVDGIYGPETEAALLQCIKDVQEQLNTYGGYKLNVDGLVGEATIDAIKKFQTDKGLKADGIAGIDTMAELNKVLVPKSGGGQGSSDKGSSGKGGWESIEYFKKEEFKCDCNGKYCNGYPAELSLKLVHILEQVRKKYGKPITITSGMRCTRQNQIDGGISNSKHLYGKAADFWFSGMDKQAVIAYCKTLPGYNYAYTNNSNMLYAVHIDVV